MSDTKKRIAAIRERLEKATPGLWAFKWPDVTDEGHYQVPQIFSVDNPDAPRYLAEIATGRNEYGDGPFIANAPSDITFLLEQVEKSIGWVEITDDPETLPKEGVLVAVYEKLGPRVFAATRRGDWFESKSYGNLICLHIPDDCEHWSDCLPVPPHRDRLE